MDTDTNRSPALPPLAAAECLTRWTVGSVPGGGIRIREVGRHRWKQAVPLFAFSAIWNGFVGTFVAGQLGLLPGYVSIPTGALVWLFLTPFVAIGQLMLVGLVFTVFGREEWLLLRGSFTTRYTFLGYRRVREYPAGELELMRIAGGEGPEQSAALTLVSPGAKRPLAVGEPAELKALGVTIAGYTGWPLRETQMDVPAHRAS
jgi:hypothetical protein